MRDLIYYQELKMRFNASRLTLLFIAVFALAGSGLQVGRAEEKNGEQPVKSSRANSSLTATNSQVVQPKQNGLKQLEQDLFKPFDRIAPKGSLQDAFAPPAMEPQAPPPVQGKQAKKLLDYRKNWVFETPEEILAGPSNDKITSGRNSDKDYDEKSSLSPVERFYERLYNKKEPSSKGNKRDDIYDSLKPARLTDQSDFDDDANLPAGIRETQREIRKRLDSKERMAETYGEASGNFFSDVFGLGKSKPSRDEIEIQRERMDKYKELVGLPVSPRIENDPLKQYRDMLGASPKALGPISTMDSLGRPSQQSIFATQPASGGIANLNLLPEGAQIHQAPSLAPVLPKPEPPKMLPPPVSFSVPRRSF